MKVNVLLVVCVAFVVGVGVACIFPKPRAWVAKNWKLLAKVAAGLFGGAVVEGVYDVVSGAIIGKVGATGQKFAPTDATHVLVKTNGKWVQVPLPPGATSDHVTAVAVTLGADGKPDPTKPPVVEVDNASVDKT